MYRYIVQDVERSNGNILTLSLRPAQGQTPLQFRPGQYATISFMHNGRPTPMRCFSMMTSPTEAGRLQFGMRVKGRFTQAAAQLTPGEEVRLLGPFGSFTEEPWRDNAIVMIAGGIGITPFMSIIRHATATQSPTPLRLLFACRDGNIPYAEELMRLQEQNPRFKAIFFCEQTTRLPTGSVVPGRITAEQLKAVVGDHFNTVSYFLCGPKPMMSAAQRLLRSWRVPEEKIVIESFAQGPAFSLPNWKTAAGKAYTLSALGLALAIGVIAAVDLRNLVNREAAKKAAASTASAATTLTNSQETTSELSEDDAAEATTAKDDTAPVTAPVTTPTTPSRTSKTTSTPSTSTTTTPSQPATTYTPPSYSPPTRSNDPPRGGVS